ncbi:MAG: EscU/YscU/HrcU family type III secretion system export apparatus switch protein [bacterium]|nr:EscU/YscU/HrcU family type III secretion system export apparatus switch protein [bacterium]
MTADKKAAAMTEDKKAAALRYDEEKESAPRVIASGKGTVAEEIIRLARDMDIPIHEDPDLVEMLAALDVGKEIPEELYQVVAEILAFIYEMNEKALPAKGVS